MRGIPYLIAAGLTVMLVGTASARPQSGVVITSATH